MPMEKNRRAGTQTGGLHDAPDMIRTKRYTYGIAMMIPEEKDATEPDIH